MPEITGEMLFPTRPANRRELDGPIRTLRGLSERSRSSWRPPFRSEWETWAAYAVTGGFRVTGPAGRPLSTAVLTNVDLSRIWRVWNWDHLSSSDNDFVITLFHLSLNAVAEIRRMAGVRPNRKVDYVRPFGGQTRAGMRLIYHEAVREDHSGPFVNVAVVHDSVLDNVRNLLLSRNWSNYWSQIVMLYGNLGEHPLDARADGVERPIPPPTTQRMRRTPSLAAVAVEVASGRAVPRTLAQEYQQREPDASMSTDMLVKMLEQKRNLPGPIRDAIYELLLQDQLASAGAPGDEE